VSLSLSSELLDDGYALTVTFSKDINISKVDRSILLMVKITNKDDFSYITTSITTQQIVIIVKANSNIKNQDATVLFTDEFFVYFNSLKQN